VLVSASEFYRVRGSASQPGGGVEQVQASVRVSEFWRVWAQREAARGNTTVTATFSSLFIFLFRKPISALSLHVYAPLLYHSIGTCCVF